MKFYIKFIFPIFSLSLSALPLFAEQSLLSDPIQLLRAGQWKQLKSYFKVQRPGAERYRYALARAYDEEHDRKSDAESGEVIRYYLSVLNINCTSYNTENNLLQCLSGYKEGSWKHLYDRLAIHKASLTAEKKKWFRLESRILSLADLQKEDPLSVLISAEYISTEINNGNYAKAADISLANPSLHSPVLDLRRAVALYKAGKKNDALGYYFQSASSTDISWILISIYKNLKSNYPDIFLKNLSPDRYKRSFVHFSSFMNAGELNTLITSLPASELISSSGPQTLLHDGHFLILTGRENMLMDLSERNYTYLSQKPGILADWLKHLKEKNKIEMGLLLTEKFKHTVKNKAALWRIKLDLLEKTKNSDVYFTEVVSYLEKNHSDYRISDKLIEFLIGNDSKSIKWAPYRYWKEASQRLTHQTGSGRFLYWQKRYFEANNNKLAYNEILTNYYESAPGSYYAQSFWDISKSTSFASDWEKVNDRKSYLAWVAVYGGNENAVKFLSGKYRDPYLDPDALRVAAWIRNLQYRIPFEITALYEAGELSLAEDFYDSQYSNEISFLEHLRRKIYIGRVTGNLHMSVYYLRTLLREMNIPEDPFSLPAEILYELYPRPYFPYVEKYAAKYKINPYVVYSLMRQESMYRETAVSSSGARGLMQVMPRTGAWLAKMMKLNNYDLMSPEHSIHLGTKYISDLLRSYGNDFRWASIAYNGGPGNLAKWKKRYYNGDFNLFLENIPKEESRNYCRFTYQNFFHYKTTYTLYP